MLIKSGKFISFHITKLIYSILFINIILINSVYAGKSLSCREDTDPEAVAPKIIKLINENYLGENGENNLYLKNIGDYSLEMKFLFLNLIEGEININYLSTGGIFFSYINPNIDIIFSLRFSKIPKNEGVSVLYDTPKLDFKLKSIYANIETDYIEFEKQPNNTYKHVIGQRTTISIDNTSLKYPEKIKKFLNDNEKELELFLLNSFDNYIRNITDYYPKSNEILLYETVVLYIKRYKTFSVSKYEQFSNLKIFFKEFKEEKIFYRDGTVIISNVNIKFDFITNNYYTTPYDVIVPFITCYGEYFYFLSTKVKVGELLLSDILDFVFKTIIKFYTEEY